MTAYNARRRTSEIGVRIALGAHRADIVRLVLRGAATLVGCGVVSGVPLTLLSSRLLARQLHGLSPYDPVVISTAVLALVVTVVVASLIPAVKASLVAPLDALHCDA